MCVGKNCHFNFKVYIRNVVTVFVLTVLSPHLAQDCSADDDNFLVPIAVGAALAGVTS